jgi:uncharacterized protein (TIGR03083 family)
VAQAQAAREVVAEIEQTTTTMVGTLARLTDDELLAPSALPGWTRLTITCHLRYGGRALSWMTDDTVAGRPTSFYPSGRAAQRPATLEPEHGESPLDVVTSLRKLSEALHERWRGVNDWAQEVREPDGNADLGRVTLARLALLRLTEVEVHSTDLDIGLGPWSELFVREALPMRLAWLPTRRTNHRPFPADVRRSWLLVPTDGGPTTLLTVDGTGVSSRPSMPDAKADVVIEAPSRELLALLLGRSELPAAAEFNRAFPGP